MSKFDYRRPAATAARLIERFGAPCQLKGRTVTRDPAQPNRPGEATPFEQDVTAVLVDYDEEAVDGTNIRLGDKKALVAASLVAIPVNLTGQFIDAEGTWNIVKISPLAPGGLRLLYTIQVRK